MLQSHPIQSHRRAVLSSTARAAKGFPPRGHARVYASFILLFSGDELDTKMVKEVIEISSNTSSPVKQQQPFLQEEESDYESGDETRSDGEIEGIAWEMRQLEAKFPQFKGSYLLKDRLGEGALALQSVCLST
jgi:hypothetical protein